MKSTERHKLKENEFARTVTHAREVVETRKRDIGLMATVVAILIAVVAGYLWWSRAATRRQPRGSPRAGHPRGAGAYAIPAPAPGSPLPVQQPGTFPTERAKLEAALPKFIEAADRYPSTGPGVAARFQAASILATLGRYPEAEQRYQEVVDKAGQQHLPPDGASRPG